MYYFYEKCGNVFNVKHISSEFSEFGQLSAKYSLN